MMQEAQWVTDMRGHFAQHGFYRQSDLDRLLGKPWDSAVVGSDGKLVLRTSASGMETRSATDPKGRGPEGDSPAPKADAQ